MKLIEETWIQIIKQKNKLILEGRFILKNEILIDFRTVRIVSCLTEGGIFQNSSRALRNEYSQD